MCIRDRAVQPGSLLEKFKWRRGGEKVTQHSAFHMNTAQVIYSVASTAWQGDY